MYVRRINQIRIIGKVLHLPNLTFCISIYHFYARPKSFIVERHCVALYEGKKRSTFNTQPYPDVNWKKTAFLCLCVCKILRAVRIYFINPYRESRF